jgi:putative transposase
MQRASFALLNLIHAPPMQVAWPHAPPHHFTPGGIYLLTAGTLHKAHLFDTPARRDLFRSTVLELAADYSLSLHAWAFFSNHYHLVAGFEAARVPHRVFLRHLHRELAVRLNGLDGAPGRTVIYQFCDTELTFEKSYLARLHYVHCNPVHHRLVAVARDYPWCSAQWFESNGAPAFVRSVYSFKTDRVRVEDDFPAADA